MSNLTDAEVPRALFGKTRSLATQVAHRRHLLFWAGLILVIAVLVPLSGSSFWIYTLTIVAIYAIAVVGLNALLGYAGQVSFATTAFMAIGGYGSALVTTGWHLDPWLALVIAALIAALMAVIIGIPLLRLRGHYLAMGTFALAMGAFELANDAVNVTGGPIGIPGVPPFTIGPLQLSDPLAFYFFSWVLCALAVLATASLVASRSGRAWRALATREDVAVSLGVNVRYYKLTAFIVSAVLASVAGSLYVEFTSYVSPDLYDVGIVVLLFTMLFIGGIGTPYGPLIGVAIVQIAPIFIAGLQSYESVVFEIVLLVILILRPQGIFGKASAVAPLENLLPPRLVRQLHALRGQREKVED